jgi:hypothetical protein
VIGLGIHHIQQARQSAAQKNQANDRHDSQRAAYVRLTGGRTESHAVIGTAKRNPRYGRKRNAQNKCHHILPPQNNLLRNICDISARVARKDLRLAKIIVNHYARRKGANE